MVKLTYSEQLKHPSWQKRRLEKQESAGWQCEVCGEKERMLHVHHREYFKGRMAWEYSDAELKVLCESCHTEQHDVQELLKVALSTADSSVDSHFMALGLMGGYLSASYSTDADVARAAEEKSRVYFHIGVLSYALATTSRETLSAVVDMLGIKAQEDPVSQRFCAWFESPGN